MYVENALLQQKRLNQYQSRYNLPYLFYKIQLNLNNNIQYQSGYNSFCILMYLSYKIQLTLKLPCQ